MNRKSSETIKELDTFKRENYHYSDHLKTAQKHSFPITLERIKNQVLKQLNALIY